MHSPQISFRTLREQPLRVSVASPCVPAAILRVPSRRCVTAPRSSPSRDHPRHHVPTSRPVHTSASASPATAPATAPNALQDFLAWLVANGTEGVGTAESKIGLYNGANGERGILAVAPIRKGEQLARLPLLLAITDHPDDEQSNALVYPGAPWSVRLASKLLRMRAEGAACPWYPYLQVLPPAVPTPLVNFEWEDIQDVGYVPMQDKFNQAAFLTDAYTHLSPEATAGASREEFYWALSVVHSRTFAGAAAGGGVGVRLLLPLIDMLNHAGDVATAPYGSPDPAPVSQDNVRWDMICNLKKEWYMVLTATADIEPDTEVLLSYGERANDDFFLFYGFVPPRNPHDEVPLFRDVEEAVGWHLEEFIPKGTLTPDQLQAAILAAFAAADTEAVSTPESEAALKRLDEQDAEAAIAFINCLKMCSAGRVDGRLMAAFQSLYDAARVAGVDVPDDRVAYIRQAVAKRSAQLLRGMPGSLVADLGYLAEWEAGSGEYPRHQFGAALAHYGPAIAAFEARIAEQERQAGSVRALQPSDTSSSSSKSVFVDVEPEALGSGSSAGGMDVGDASSTPQPGLVDAGVGSSSEAALYQSIMADQAQHGSGAAAPRDDETSRGAVEVNAERKEEIKLLNATLRAYKAMILWDAVLDGL